MKNLADYSILMLVIALFLVIPVNADTFTIQPIEPEDDSRNLNIGDRLEQNRNLNVNLTINTINVNTPKLKINDVNGENRSSVITLNQEVKRENNKIIDTGSSPEIKSFRVIEGLSGEDKSNGKEVNSEEDS